MGKPLSMDLRSRALATVDEGMSCRAAARREAWFEDQMDPNPERLVFIDETWTATNMTRSHGRCRQGERLRVGYPHGHRKTTTLVPGLRMTGRIAPMVLDGPIDGDWFEASCRPDARPRARTRRRRCHGQTVQPQTRQR